MTKDFSQHTFLNEPSDCGANSVLPVAASIQQMDDQHRTHGPNSNLKKHLPAKPVAFLNHPPPPPRLPTTG